MICTSCKRRLKADAVTCLCGWSASSYQPPAKVIACCFAGCTEAALCRVWTKTGWANVCRTDYPRVEFAPQPRTMTPFAVACRTELENSYTCRVKRAGEAVPGDIGGMVPSAPTVRKHGENPVERQPGQDDESPGLEYRPDMPVEDYERYIEGLAHP